MQNILIQYLAWQFIDTPKDILGGWRNCLKFNLNYWFRYSYGRGFAFKRYFEVFTFNIISRVMGAFFRSVFIVLGILTEILVVAAGVVVFLAWLFLPLLLAGGFYYGFKILF